MELATLGLAIIPPILAVLVEAINPVNERLIRNSAKIDFLEELQKSSFFLDTAGRATTLAAAAVEVSGLAPTLVASVTSGFVVVHELPKPFWPAMMYVLIFVGVAVFLLWLLGGSSFHKIGTAKIEIGFKGCLELREREAGRSGWTRQDIVRAVIYLANSVLFLAALMVFIFAQPGSVRY